MWTDISRRRRGLAEDGKLRGSEWEEAVTYIYEIQIFHRVCHGAAVVSAEDVGEGPRGGM